LSNLVTEGLASPGSLLVTGGLGIATAVTAVVQPVTIPTYGTAAYHQYWIDTYTQEILLINQELISLMQTTLQSHSYDTGQTRQSATRKRESELIAARKRLQTEISEHVALKNGSGSVYAWSGI
jgi:hypothetical protein